jgi:hypothetical protein
MNSGAAVSNEDSLSRIEADVDQLAWKPEKDTIDHPTERQH